MPGKALILSRPPSVKLSNASIPSNSLSGVVVGSLLSPLTGTINYTLLDNAGGRFQISGNAIQSGNISTNYTTSITHNIKVRADNGVDAYEKTMSIAVTKLDVTLNDIVLSGSTLYANSYPGTSVGNITGTQPNANISISSNPNNNFKIDVVNNKIRLAKSGVAAGSYPLAIYQDYGGNTKTSNISVVVNPSVAPTNIIFSDNSPRVVEKMDFGMTVVNVSCTMAQGDEIFWSLTNSANRRFEIESFGDNTGRIFYGGNIKYSVATSHTITVRATNLAGQYIESTITILVDAWTPAAIPGIIAWFDASATSTISPTPTANDGTDIVSSWSGLISSNILNKIGTGTIKYVPNAIGGKPALLFDGITSLVANSGSVLSVFDSGGNEYLVSAVFVRTIDKSADMGIISWTNTGGDRKGFYVTTYTNPSSATSFNISQSNTDSTGNANAVLINQINTKNSPTCVDWWIADADSYSSSKSAVHAFYQNGILNNQTSGYNGTLTKNAPLSNPATGFYVGSHNTNLNAANTGTGFTGYIAELIVAKVVPGGSITQNQIENWQERVANKYGITMPVRRPDVVYDGTQMTFDESFLTPEFQFRDTYQNTYGTFEPKYAPANGNLAGSQLNPTAEGEWYPDITNPLLKDKVNPFTKRNGKFEIQTILTPGSVKPFIGSSYYPGGYRPGTEYTHISGCMQTQTTFAQQYGIWEMVGSIPAGPGIWPAFWMLSASNSWPPENDILEGFGNQTPTQASGRSYHAQYFKDENFDMNPDSITGPQQGSGGSYQGGVETSTLLNPSRVVTIPRIYQGLHSFMTITRGDRIMYCFDRKVNFISLPVPIDHHTRWYMILNNAIGYYGVPNTTIVNGGSGYTYASVTVNDDGGPYVARKATFTATIVNGVITRVDPIDKGLGYTRNPTLKIVGDGTGAIATGVIGGAFTGVPLETQQYPIRYVVHSVRAFKEPLAAPTILTGIQTETQAILDYATSNSITAPTSAQTTAINDYVRLMKSYKLDQVNTGMSLWDKEDFVYFLKSHDRTFSRINWKAPGTRNIIESSTGLTWTAFLGYKGNGSTGYLDTGFDPTATNSGTKMASRDARLGVGVATLPTSDASGPYLMGTQNLRTGMTPSNNKMGIKAYTNSYVELPINRINTIPNGDPANVLQTGLLYANKLGNMVDWYINGEVMMVKSTALTGDTFSAVEGRTIWILGLNGSTGSTQKSDATVDFADAGKNFNPDEAYRAAQLYLQLKATYTS